jgi:hypothetical protein
MSNVPGSIIAAPGQSHWLLFRWTVDGGFETKHVWTVPRFENQGVALRGHETVRAGFMRRWEHC